MANPDNDKDLVFKLPKAAVSIFKQRLAYLKQKGSDIQYLQSCLYAEAYIDALKFFQEQLICVCYEFKNTMEFMADRGEYPDVPKTDQPEIDFTDLKSGVEYLLKEEISEREILQTQARDLFDMDQESYDHFKNSISSLKYNGDKLRKIYEQLGELDEKGQRAIEKNIFSSSTSELSIS